MALQPFVGPWSLLKFRYLFYTDGRTPWTRGQPFAKPLPTLRTTQTQNNPTQTSMPWVGLEPTIPTFERAKTVHALDRAVTVISVKRIYRQKYLRNRVTTIYLEKGWESPCEILSILHKEACRTYYTAVNTEHNWTALLGLTNTKRNKLYCFRFNSRFCKQHTECRKVFKYSLCQRLYVLYKYFSLINTEQTVLFKIYLNVHRIESFDWICTEPEYKVYLSSLM
jgi:hypothetical protein